MKVLEQLKEEHEKMEQYLLDLEELISSEPINFPALINTCKSCTAFWDSHEAHEEKIFKALHEAGLNVPIRKIIFEHGQLKIHKSALMNAINSGSDAKIKTALATHGQKILQTLRAHMKMEDEIIYTLPEELITPRARASIESSLG